MQGGVLFVWIDLCCCLSHLHLLGGLFCRSRVESLCKWCSAVIHSETAGLRWVGCLGKRKRGSGMKILCYALLEWTHLGTYIFVGWLQGFPFQLVFSFLEEDRKHIARLTQSLRTRREERWLLFLHYYYYSILGDGGMSVTQVVLLRVP